MGNVLLNLRNLANETALRLKRDICFFNCIKIDLTFKPLFTIEILIPPPLNLAH